MKKEYMKPAMRVVELQHQCHILSGSRGAKSLSNSEGIDWKDNGFDDEEDM